MYGMTPEKKAENTSAKLPPTPQESTPEHNATEDKALYLACANNDIKQVQTLLSSWQTDRLRSAFINEHHSPLKIACDKSYLDIIDSLFSHFFQGKRDSAPENLPENKTRDRYFYSILKEAFIKKQTAVIKTLLKWLPFSAIESPANFELLGQLSQEGEAELVKLLLPFVAGQDETLPFAEHEPLRLACEQGHLSVLQTLLDYHALHHQDISDYLKPKHDSPKLSVLQLGVFNTSQNHNVVYITPLWLACAKGHAGIVNELLQRYAPASRCRADVIKEIGLYLHCGEEGSTTRASLTSPFQIACRHGHLNVVALLIGSGRIKEPFVREIRMNKNEKIKFTDRNSDKIKLFMQIIISLLCQFIQQKQLNFPADADKAKGIMTQWHEEVALGNETDRHIQDILSAVKANQGVIAEHLLNYTLPMFARPTLPKPISFVHACEIGDLAAVQTFLEHDWFATNSNDPQYQEFYKNSRGLSGFSVACEQGHTAIVKFLLEHPKTTDMVFEYRDEKSLQRSGFAIACEHGHTAVVKLLLEHHRTADMAFENFKDSNGNKFRSPFHTQPISVAVIRQHRAIVELLLDAYQAKNIPLPEDHSYRLIADACDPANPELLRVLLNRVMTTGIREIFIKAWKDGQLKTVKVFLDTPAINFSAGVNNQTFLWRACREGHTELVKELFSRYVPGKNTPLPGKFTDIGLNQPCPSTDRQESTTPFQIACSSGGGVLIQLLAESGYVNTVAFDLNLFYLFYPQEQKNITAQQSFYQSTLIALLKSAALAIARDIFIAKSVDKTTIETHVTQWCEQKQQTHSALVNAINNNKPLVWDYVLILYKHFIPLQITRFFLAVVLLCDDYFQLQPTHSAPVPKSQMNALRFFRICAALHMNAQIVLVHRLFDSTANIISSPLINNALKEWAPHNETAPFSAPIGKLKFSSN